MLDLADQLGSEISEVVHIVPARLLGRHAQDLGVLAGLVAHVQHADRASGNPHAGIHRVFEQHESIERIAVAAQRFGDVPVVGRIRGRREQPPVEEHPARVVIDLVLVPATAWNFDDDVDAIVRQRTESHVAMLAYLPWASGSQQVA